jgi:uncharacterized protein YjdB
LNQSSAILTVGEKLHLEATVLPNNATNKNVIWSSIFANVANVVDGEVVALAIGTTIITATTEDGGLSASCKIIVKHANTNGSDMDLNPGLGNM